MPAARSRKFDIVGKRFGLLICLSDDDAGKDRKAFFRCDCGVEKAIIERHVRRGRVVSCGCHGRQTAARTFTKHGHSKVGARTTEYRIWYAMKDRVLNPACHAFPDYGGRGIGICDRWRDSFENFLADMGRRPKGLSIDRIDNDGNYEPGNCRWATAKQQANNKRPPKARRISMEAGI